MAVPTGGDGGDNNLDGSDNSPRRKLITTLTEAITTRRISENKSH
jgi:hypothetical protein